MKRRITNYTFNAAGQTVTFTDINPVLLEGVLLITNTLLANQEIIYNFADNTKGGSVTGASSVLTLEHDTTSMADTDPLQIWYDDGEVEHDIADIGWPVKIGAKATDYEPDSEDEQGAAEVAAGDRVNLAANLRGEIIEGVNRMYHATSGIDDTYDNVTTTNTSAAVECWNYRWCTVSLSLVSATTPTDMLIEVEILQEGGHWHKMMDGFLGDWRYDDTSCATIVNEAMTFPINAHSVRVKVTATGTDATKTFVISNSSIALRN